LRDGARVCRSATLVRGFTSAAGCVDFLRIDMKALILGSFALLSAACLYLPSPVSADTTPATTQPAAACCKAGAACCESNKPCCQKDGGCCPTHAACCGSGAGCCKK